MAGELKSKYDLERLYPDRAADGKAIDPAFIDSVFERQYNDWLGKQSESDNKIKLKRRK